MRPVRPIGFCLGRNLLTPVARVWRARPDRVADAQHELRSRLNHTSVVLRAGLNEVRRRGGVLWWDAGDRGAPHAAS